ncbi:endonuclease domain-containing 1 protein-like [Oncorhynchus mykiss]|uniref:endonuclease domain-containing 1 protein-like n=2 Tax=Oncorhynchus TaxID=8016 RepID=UPI0018787348|nr:endonuclease domain-containing 1 protein-like [Oncorhynchus mykiss]
MTSPTLEALPSSHLLPSILPSLPIPSSHSPSLVHSHTNRPVQVQTDRIVYPHLTMLLSCVLLALLPLPPPVNPSVDSSFRECSQFLYRGLAPRGLQGTQGLQKVCQHYGDKARYATLYDPAGRIPLFSAYTFKRSNGESREGLPWMYEPQLSSGSGTGNMQPFPGSPSSLLALEESQAVLADYSDAVVYERGQLNPDQHQASPGDKASTYTLTNVVPQAKEFLHHHWLPYLEGIRKRLNNYCRGTAYIISGVTTTGNTIRRGNVHRVGVPKHLWTAYCCPDFDLSAPYELRYKFPTYAAYGLNDVVDNAVTETSTKSVEALVNREMAVDQDFQLFNGNCVPEV